MNTRNQFILNSVISYSSASLLRNYYSIKEIPYTAVQNISFNTLKKKNRQSRYF